MLTYHGRRCLGGPAADQTPSQTSAPVEICLGRCSRLGAMTNRYTHPDTHTPTHTYTHTRRYHDQTLLLLLPLLVSVSVYPAYFPVVGLPEKYEVLLVTEQLSNR